MIPPVYPRSGPLRVQNAPLRPLIDFQSILKSSLHSSGSPMHLGGHDLPIHGLSPQGPTPSSMMATHGTVEIFTKLGLQLNVQKSTLSPVQHLEFIGADFYSLQARAFLPQHRFQSVHAHKFRPVHRHQPGIASSFWGTWRLALL